MSQQIDFFNIHTDETVSTIVADLDDLETLNAHHDTLIEQGVSDLIGWRVVKLPSEPAKPSQVEIKQQCTNHILQYFPAEAQRNLAMAQSLGQLSTEQAVMLVDAFNWINQCRYTSQMACQNPTSDDVYWPEPPDTMASLVSQF